MKRESIQDRAQGRWNWILPEIGIGAAFLTGRHGPCPMCGGRDRFRFDNKDGKGTFYCTNCKSGTGIDLVMRFSKVQFAEACRMVEKHIPNAQVVIPKAKAWTSQPRLMHIWDDSMRIDGESLVTRYLRARGIELNCVPSAIRLMHRARYKHEDGSYTEHPAMLAKIVGSDGQSMSLHFTYLDEATSKKAAVPKQRLNAAAKVPDGGAVRLAPAAEVMGVAEGIENAFSADQLFGIPTWAALSTSGLVRWQPPPEARHIVIFGDSDAAFGGQHAAYALAQKLVATGYDVEVRLPTMLGTDWNDVLMERRAAKRTMELNYA